MAKLTKSISFKNAVISMEDLTITEYTKDDTKTYSIIDVLKDWNGLEGISFSIKTDDELPSIEDSEAVE